MANFKKRKKIIAFSLASIILLLGGQFLWNTMPVHATRDFNFYSKSDTKTGERVPVETPSGMYLDSWDVVLNGVSLGKIGTYDAANDEIVMDVTSSKQKRFIGRAVSDPGHHIWRDLSGVKWRTQGLDENDQLTGNYEFTGAGISGGVSQYPGSFPATAYNITTGSNELMPTALRYSDGSAATIAWEAEPPPDFYPDVLDDGTPVNITDPNYEKTYQSVQQPRSIIIDNSIKILQATIEWSQDSDFQKSPGTFVDDVGKGHDGYGYIKAHRMLNEENSELSDYENLGGNNLVEGRNYKMSVHTAWEGYSYEFKGKVNVTFKPTEKPDLTINKMEGNDLKVGQLSSIHVTIRNNGVAVNSNFKLHCRADGIPLQNSPLTINSLGKDQSQTINFSYTFTGVQTKQFDCKVDYGSDMNDTGAIDESNEQNNYMSKNLTPDFGLDGDFDVVPNNIKIREPFKLKPRDFKIPDGCTYQSHSFNMIRSDGTRSWYVGSVNGQTTNLDVTYEDYRGDLTVGTWTVYLNIDTSCGETGWKKPKTLEILPDPTNTPPFFKIGFFKAKDENGTKPLEEVAIDTKVSLRIINDPNSDPPSPSDPDGDLWTHDFNFSEPAYTDWVKNIPNRFPYNGETQYKAYKSLTANVAGLHCVSAEIRDTEGATYEASTCLDVVPPNPIPRIDGPSFIKVNRTIQPAFTAEDSYSRPSNVGINHSLDKWEFFNPAGGLIGNSPPTQPINEVGTYKLTLEVTDNKGNRSLPEDKDTHVLEIVEDKPPVPFVVLPETVYRNAPISITNNSFSPDGDSIVETWVHWSVDEDEDGSYTDEVQHSAINGLGKFTFTPTKLGKVRFTVYAKEDYGKEATQDFFMDVNNGSPEVSFKTKSEMSEPNPDTAVVISPDKFVSSEWTATSFILNDARKLWHHDTSEGSLATGMMYYNNFSGTPALYGSSYYMPSGNNMRTWSWSYYQGPEEGGGYTYLGDFTYMLEYNDEAYHSSNDRITYTIVKNGVGIATIPTSYYDYYDGDPFIVDKINLETGYMGFIENHYDGTENDIYRILNLQDVRRGIFSSSKKCKYGTNPKNKNPECSTIAEYNLLHKNLDLSQNQYVGSLDATNTTSAGIIKYTAIRDNQMTCDQYYDDCFYLYTHYLTKSHIDGTVIWNKELTDIDRRNGSLQAKYTLSPNGEHLLLDIYNIYSSNPHYIYFLKTLDGSSSGDQLEPSNVTYRLFRTDTGICAWEYDEGGCGDNYYDYSVAKYINNSKVWQSTTIIPSHSGQIPGAESIVPFLIYNGAAEVCTLFNVNSTLHSGCFKSDTGESLSANSQNAERTPALTDMYDKMSKTKQSMSISSNRDWQTGKYSYELKFYENGVLVRTEDFTDKIPPGYRTTLNPNVDVKPTPLGDNLVQVPIYIYNGNDVNTIGFVYIESDPGHATQKSEYDDIKQAGQLINYSDPELADINLSYKLKFNEIKRDDMIDNSAAGLSFRIKDRKNMYRVETTPSKTYLYRIVDGVKTKLAVGDATMVAGQYMPIDIRAVGQNIKVKVNGFLIIDVNDPTFSSGRFGPFSHRNFTEIKDVSLVMKPAPSINVVNDVALVGGEVTYETRYEDIENDPIYAAGTGWYYEHTDPNRFLNAGDGKSGLSTNHQKQYSTPIPVFDKVGLYKIDYWVHDDVTPISYRKKSNVYAKYLQVHRAPKTIYALSLNADNSVNWNDTSYDPDRCSVGGSCMAAYSGNKGIFDRKYSYITPSGQLVNRQLVLPTEPGTYRVFMAVMDEFRAWGELVEQTVTIAGPLPPPNNLPDSQIVIPSGTSLSNPSIVYTTTPTITWTQTDSDGLYFSHYHLQAIGEDGIIAYDSGAVQFDSYSGSHSINVPAGLLSRGKKYGIRVKVRDGKEWQQDWSDYKYLVVNAAPTVTIVNPTGTEGQPTLINSDKRPAIQWRQSDNESGYFQTFNITITNASGQAIYNSGWRNQNTYATTNSFEITTDLPTNEVLYAQMRVTDEETTLLSEYSNKVYFIINYAPSVSFTFPTGTQASPTPASKRPEITWAQIDPDTNTTFTMYRVIIRNESGTTTLVDTGEQNQNTTSTSGSYQVTTDLPVGQKVRATVMVWDNHYIASPWATERWMFINEPPLADFTWSPQPAWEGDQVTLTNTSTDPDGDSLTYAWEVIAPDSTRATYTTKDVNDTFSLPGQYRVTLTVSDGKTSDTVTKSIWALELEIYSEVYHTPQWLVNHQNKNHNTTTVPKDFYSGEIFMLETESSPYPVSSVTAWIDTIGIDGNALVVNTTLQADGVSTRYKGQLFDEKFLSVTKGLPNGEQVVYFGIEYANGVIKEDSVPVDIIGNANKSVGVHRRQ